MQINQSFPIRFVSFINVDLEKSFWLSNCVFLLAIELDKQTSDNGRKNVVKIDIEMEIN